MPKILDVKESIQAECRPLAGVMHDPTQPWPIEGKRFVSRATVDDASRAHCTIGSNDKRYDKSPSVNHETPPLH